MAKAAHDHSGVGAAGLPKSVITTMPNYREDGLDANLGRLVKIGQV